MSAVLNRDPLKSTDVARSYPFSAKEEAIRFCEKNGWEYALDAPPVRNIARQRRYNSYGDNFSTKRKGLPDLNHLNTHRDAVFAK